MYQTLLVAGYNICILRIIYYCVLCVLYCMCNEAQQNLMARFGSRKTGLSPPPPPPPQYFNTDRSKAVLLLWFLTVTCSCCPYLYFGSLIMWVTYLGSWMTIFLEKSCSFGLPRVPFVNCCQLMYLVISLLVVRAGYGSWLYQFLIIAYRFTLLKQRYKSFFSTGRFWTILYAPQICLKVWQHFLLMIMVLERNFMLYCVVRRVMSFWRENILITLCLLANKSVNHNYNAINLWNETIW